MFKFPKLLYWVLDVYWAIGTDPGCVLGKNGAKSQPLVVGIFHLFILFLVEAVGRKSLSRLISRLCYLFQKYIRKKGGLGDSPQKKIMGIKE